MDVHLDRVGIHLWSCSTVLEEVPIAHRGRENRTHGHFSRSKDY